MTNDQPKEFVHQPFAWLNVDKLQADSEAYFHDLGLIDYYPAILNPLQSAVQTLIEVRQGTINLSSSKLPAINKDVLNDPIKLQNLIDAINNVLEPPNYHDFTDEQRSAHENGFSEHMLELFNNLIKQGRLDEFEGQLFNSCSYCIDGLDLIAIFQLKLFDDFNSLFNDDKKTRLETFGLIYAVSAILFIVGKSLEVGKDGVLNYLNVLDGISKYKARYYSIIGGNINHKNAEKDREHIKIIGLQELQSDFYREIKLRHYTEKQKQKYNTQTWVPWRSSNFAATKTIDRVNKKLTEERLQAKDNGSPNTSAEVGKTRYYEIVQSIEQEHPELFISKNPPKVLGPL